METNAEENHNKEAKEEQRWNMGTENRNVQQLKN